MLSLRDQHKTAEGSPSDDDSYLGYSVATGEFNGDGDNADVVVGMPRGANLTGKVHIERQINVICSIYAVHDAVDLSLKCVFLNLSAFGS